MAGFKRWLLSWQWPARRVFFRLFYMMRPPRKTAHGIRKRPGIPEPGELVVDCRGQLHAVASYDRATDHVILDDGYGCSWQHCCTRMELRGSVNQGW